MEALKEGYSDHAYGKESREHKHVGRLRSRWSAFTALAKLTLQNDLSVVEKLSLQLALVLIPPHSSTAEELTSADASPTVLVSKVNDEFSH